MIRKVITEGRRLSYLNRSAVSGRCGLILSGPAGTGKTTAITQLGKMTEVMHRRRIPAPAATSRSSTSPRRQRPQPR